MCLPRRRALTRITEMQNGPNPRSTLLMSVSTRENSPSRPQQLRALSPISAYLQVDPSTRNEVCTSRQLNDGEAHLPNLLTKCACSFSAVRGHTAPLGRRASTTLALDSIRLDRVFGVDCNVKDTFPLKLVRLGP